MITTGSSMQAMTFMAPLQALQISMSILKTRLGHCALVNAMDGMYAGFAGAKTGHRHSPFRRGWRSIGHPGLVAPAPPGRRHQRPVLGIRCKHTVEAGGTVPVKASSPRRMRST